MDRLRKPILMLLIISAMLFVGCAPAAPPTAAPPTTAPPTTAPPTAAPAVPTSAPVKPTEVPAAAKPTEAPTAAKPAEVVKVSFWSRDSDQDLVNGFVKLWNASHPNIQIEVTIIPVDQFVTKFAAAVAGGAGPDLTAIDLIYTPQFASLDQLTDITDLAKSMPEYNKLSPSHVRLGIYQGKNYALPFSADASILVWNKDLFKQAGLDPEKGPTTWAEIHDYAKKITALGNGNYGFYFSGNCGGCNEFTFLPYIWASGGDVLSADNTQATLTDPKVKDALNFYLQMWNEKLVPPGAKTDTGTDFVSAFTTGKVGMEGSGGFMIGILKNQFPKINFGVTFLPGQNGGKGSFAGGDNIAIPKGSKHVQEAFQFIKWLYTDDIQLEYVAKSNNTPVRTDLASNKYFDADPRLSFPAQAMALGRTPYAIHCNEIFNDSSGPWLAMLQKAIFDGKVDEAIATAQNGFTTFLNEK